MYGTRVSASNPSFLFVWLRAHVQSVPRWAQARESVQVSLARLRGGSVMADGAECASDLGGGGEFNETFSFRGMDLSIKQDTVAGHAHVLWDASRVLGACCKPCVPAPLDLPLHLDPKFHKNSSLQSPSHACTWCKHSCSTPNSLTVLTVCRIGYTHPLVCISQRAI